MNRDDAICPSSRRRTGVQSHPQKDHTKSRADKSSTAVDLPPDDGPPDSEALRKARDYIKSSADGRKTKMKYVGEIRTRESAGKEDIHHGRNKSGSKRRRKVVDRERKHGERKLRLSEVEPGEYQPVYQRRYREQVAESGGAELEEIGSDEVDGGDAQVATPASPLPRPTKRQRTETESTRPVSKKAGADTAKETKRANRADTPYPLPFIWCGREPNNADAKVYILSFGENIYMLMTRWDQAERTYISTFPAA